MNNWIDISGPNLHHNLHVLQRAAGPATEVLAVVKANAYGHGAELCAQHLVQAGARWFGVTCASEGVRVRAALGPAPEILLMCGFLPDDATLLRDHRLIPVLWTAEHITWLAACPGLRVHVEIDTGMGRQGVQSGPQLAALLTQLAASSLVVDGLFTHFASSESADPTVTHRQQRLFEQAVAQALGAGCRPGWIHAGNTSTLDNPAQPEPWLTTLAATAGARAMVRSGLALYGHCLPTPNPRVRLDLRPVLTWRARVLAVHTLAPGDTVGYSGTFTAVIPMRVALIPAGYADGLRRELSGPHGWVILAGLRAPILGRISMNLTVVDITHIPAIQPNDEAILLGPGITAEDHATLAATIPYEILCGLHPCG